eukprot:TRINITY_DN4721_c0_g1_i1.p1 TRINITY_DN4721_c0_g1~~TRINITY_DN4721_c0_g1_i1.p1  ORF type:complete len:546 (+),score=118.86 TRINITY_DN4721_c0_g1_i1:166-1638(+)
MEMCKDLESKSDKVANPAGYLLNAVNKENANPRQTYGSSYGNGGAGYNEGYGGYDEGYGGSGGYEDYGDYGYQASGNQQYYGQQETVVSSRLHRRCTWLNANVFWQGAIDEKAIEQLSGIDVGRAMEMLKDLEDKAELVANPSGYLKNSVRREGRAAGANVGMVSQGYGYADGGVQPQYGSAQEVSSRVHRRCTWLNANVFWQGSINEKVVAALSSIDMDRAMEMLQDVESKAQRVSNPGGFLMNACRREGMQNAGYDASYAANTRYDTGYVEHYAPENTQVNSAVHRRCTWLNANVFWQGAIDEEAVAQLSGIDGGRSMEMLKILESKADTVANPSGYLKNAVRKEVGARAGTTWDEGGEWGWLPQNRGGGCEQQQQGDDWGWSQQNRVAGGGGQQQGDLDERIRKRCTWLNTNVFGIGAIDREAMVALSTLEYGRAMAMCKEVEEKGSNRIANPSGYLKVAVRKESEHPRGKWPGERAQWVATAADGW